MNFTQNKTIPQSSIAKFPTYSWRKFYGYSAIDITFITQLADRSAPLGYAPFLVYGTYRTKLISNGSVKSFRVKDI